jgi:hypothetical protein
MAPFSPTIVKLHEVAQELQDDGNESYVETWFERNVKNGLAGFAPYLPSANQPH